MAEVKVKKAALHNEGDLYYIDVTYIYEDEKFVKEIRIPKLEIPLTTYGDIRIETVDRFADAIGYKSLDGRRHSYILDHYLGLNRAGLKMLDDYDNCCIYEKIIKEKSQEMTLEEIEKKLGYKIKIVSKKEAKK